jgi:large-conductance mechanosensitive channel
LKILKRVRNFLNRAREEIEDINLGRVIGWLVKFILLVFSVPFLFFHLIWMAIKAIQKEPAEFLESPAVVPLETLYAVSCYLSPR